MELAQAILASGDVLTLRRSGDAFEIRFNLTELMSSRNSVSESALAEIACRRIDRPAARILIGGLGMGYTVRAALDRLGPDARIVVAEIVPEVVAWNRGPIADLAGRPLDDPRVTVHAGDVRDVAEANPNAFDAVLMDVDNGPGAILFPSNRGLYSKRGLEQMLSSLKPGGILALWAADRSPEFEHVLGAGGFRAERVNVAVGGGAALEHSLYLVRTG